jgi:hypothetical protein
VNQAKLAAANFGYSIVGYGSPGVDGFNVTLPIIIRFNNPTPVAANVDNITANIFINEAGKWVQSAKINQPLSVPAGVSDQKINAKIDLSSFFKGGVLSVLQEAANIYATKFLQVRTDVTVTYGPLTLPAQSFTSNIQIG